MLSNILKILSITFCSIYVYHKMIFHTNRCLLNKNNIFTLILLFFTSLILTYTFKDFSYFIPLILFWIILSINTNQPQKSFISATISFTISFGIHALSSLLISVLLCIIYINKQTFPFTLLAILSTLLHNLLIYLFCKNKRLNAGMPRLVKQKTLNISTVICILLSFSTVYFTYNKTLTIVQWSAIFIINLTLAFLIYWWQAQITKTYRRNLELRELESMRTEMAELKKQMEELKAENDRLARITHRDNTLISALKNSTVKYLSTDFANPAVAEEVRNQLIENINTLSAERASLMTAHKEVSAREFATGLSLLDTLLHEMDEKALEMKITFAVHMGISLNEFIPNVVLESDLVHTVDDLLKNAFKATRSSEKRVVQLQFYKLGKNLVIEVADSGIPFEVKSLVNMGVEKLTTYEDGSGIGLMDIWNTKETYGATYHLEECVNAAPFTKKISLTFDKKNRYSIRTLRKDEILQASRRADLQVYDFSE